MVYGATISRKKIADVVRAEARVISRAIEDRSKKLLEVERDDISTEREKLADIKKIQVAHERAVLPAYNKIIAAVETLKETDFPKINTTSNEQRAAALQVIAFSGGTMTLDGLNSTLQPLERDAVAVQLLLPSIHAAGLKDIFSKTAANKTLVDFNRYETAKRQITDFEKKLPAALLRDNGMEKSEGSLGRAITVELLVKAVETAEQIYDEYDE